MIRFDNVTFGYQKEQPVLQGITLELPDGCRRVIRAPSGGGKTTFLRLVMGLEKPWQGTICTTQHVRFSAVFQEDRLLEETSVVRNVSLFSDEDTARGLLQALGLGDVLSAMPKELSGGMRRRVALARALAHPFDVLILDEPMTGLDQAMREQCLCVIDEVVGEKTLLIASHDAYDGKMLQATEIYL